MCEESSRCFFFVVMLDFHCFSFTAAFMAFKPLILCNSRTPCAPTSQGLCQKSHLKSCNIIDPENLPGSWPYSVHWMGKLLLTDSAFICSSFALSRVLSSWREWDSIARVEGLRSSDFGPQDWLFWKAFLRWMLNTQILIPSDTGGKMKTALWINLIWYLMNGPHLR